MRKRLVILMLLCGGTWAYAQSCGVDFGTDAPQGSCASSRSNDPCDSSGFGSLLQERPPVLRPKHRDSLLARRSSDPSSTALSQQGSAALRLSPIRRDQFRVLKTPSTELRNTFPSYLLDTIGTIPPAGRVAGPEQQIATLTKSRAIQRGNPSEIDTNRKNSMAEATTAQDAQKESWA